MENRREFITRLAGVFGGVMLFLKSSVAFAKKKLALPLEKVKALQTVGGSARVKLSGKEILLIRDATGSVLGLSPKCTHQDCYVKYNKNSGKIDCSCHGSSFDKNGKVLKGPATTDLKKYPTTLKDGRVIIEVN